MSKGSLEFCLSTLIGFGLGITLSKRRYDHVKIQRDVLRLRNRQLEAERENWRKDCGKEKTIKLYTEFLKREEDE